MTDGFNDEEKRTENEELNETAEAAVKEAGQEPAETVRESAEAAQESAEAAQESAEDAQESAEDAQPEKTNDGIILIVLAAIAASIFAAGLFLGGIARCTTAKEVMNAIAMGLFFSALVFVIPACVANMVSNKGGRAGRKKWVTLALLIGGLVAIAALVLTVVGWF